MKALSNGYPTWRGPDGVARIPCASLEKRMGLEPNALSRLAREVAGLETHEPLVVDEEGALQLPELTAYFVLNSLRLTRLFGQDGQLFADKAHRVLCEIIRSFVWQRRKPATGDAAAEYEYTVPTSDELFRLNAFGGCSISEEGALQRLMADALEERELQVQVAPALDRTREIFSRSAWVAGQPKPIRPAKPGGHRESPN